MTIPLPDLDDPTTWARGLTERGLRTSGRPAAGVVAFEDTSPVVLVRPGSRHELVPDSVNEVLLVLGLVGGFDGVVAVQPMMLRDPDARGVARDSTAQPGVLVTVGRVVEGAVVVRAVAHTYDLDDEGAPVWSEVIELDEEGPMDRQVAAAVGTDPPAPDLRVGMLYAADRFGHGIGVADTWRDRHLTGRIDHREVRPVDRRRARRRPVTAGGRS